MIRIMFRVLEINLSWVIDVNKSVFLFFEIQLVVDRAIESVKQAFGLPRLW